MHSRAIKYFLDFLDCPIQKTALHFDALLVVAFTKVFIHASISIYTVELHKRTPNLIHFFFPTKQCWLRSNENVKDGWKLLDICFFCFAGLILGDCLELSCLLLVFHKCNSRNNEIHKKPILYECKLWLLIDKTIKQSLYRHLGLCLLFSWEACFACGTIFDLRLQDIIQDKSIYASCKYLKLHLHRRRA